MMILYDCDEYPMVMIMTDNIVQSRFKAILDIKETEITHKRR